MTHENTQIQLPPLGDPTTGEAIVTLNDGVPRRLVFNFRGFRLFEEITGVPFSKIHELVTGAVHVRALLYAGLYDDAKKRGERWTLDRVDELVELDAVPELSSVISWAMGVAMTKLIAGAQSVGEMKAGASRGAGE